MQIGLVGASLQHSFSQKYFTEKFRNLGVQNQYEYLLFEILQIDEIQNIVSQHHELIGLNITSPYKEKIIPYLDEIDDSISDLGAVNVVKIIRNENKTKLIGYNTDIYGVKKTLSDIGISQNSKALVLGSGGASKAVNFALSQIGISSTTVSRNPQKPGQISYSMLSEKIMSEHNLIINATPVGMFPDVADFPSIPYCEISENHTCLDLIYNPAKTIFLEKSEKQGAKICNGLAMLHEQADKAWEIWNKQTK